MEQKKIRVGGGKKMSDTWLKSSICLDTLKEHAFEYQGKWYAKLNINVFREPNEHGKDVSITIDTYKPDQNKQANVPEKKSAPATVVDAEIIDGDLPF
jgi:hypothetical protein